MKISNFPFTFWLAIPLLCACVSDDSPADMPQQKTPIDFGTAVDQPVSRTGETTTDNLSSIGVYAYFTGSNNFTDSDTPNFMCNQEVSRSNNRSPWTYSPVKYWPNNQTDKLSFFAYGPYNAKGLVVSSATQSGLPTIEYTIQAKENDQSDLVIATPVKNRMYVPNSGQVSFGMNHVLTRVDIYATNVDKVADMQITKFSLSSLLDAKRTLDDNSSWKILSAGTGVLTKVYCEPAKLPCSVPASGEKMRVACFFLMPISGLGYNPIFSITYTSKGSASYGEAPVQTVELKAQKVPSPTTWIDGAHLSYNFQLEKKKVTVTASTHSTWNDAGTGTITGSVVITNPVNPLDPSWENGGSGSAEGKPIVTSLN